MCDCMRGRVAIAHGVGSKRGSRSEDDNLKLITAQFAVCVQVKLLELTQSDQTLLRRRPDGLSLACSSADYVPCGRDLGAAGGKKG